MAVRAKDSVALFSTKIVYDYIAAQEIRVNNLEAITITTDNLSAKMIEAGYITATEIASNYAAIGDLNAATARIGTLESTAITATTLDAALINASTITSINADISDLQANAITADTLDAALINADTISAINLAIAGKADINLLNVTLASGEALITQTGYINTAVITDLTADSLRLRGKDGLYYAINIDEGEVTTQEADQALDVYGRYITGKTIIDKTIVADKLYVTDLSAIKADVGTAMIGGLTLESSSIHTANTTSVSDNDTGFYLNSAGEMLLKGANGALKFYNDSSDNNKRKLEITADELFIGSKSMATISNYAEKGVKTSIQLWYTKANTTAPAKPTSAVSSTSTDGNAWRVVVPTYNASYPYYYYCFQYLYNDGTYGWSDVVRDLATEESQAQARTAAGDLATYITSTNATITNLQSQLDGQIEAWYRSGAPGEGGSGGGESGGGGETVTPVSIGTKTTTPSSAGSSISFTGLSGEPTSFIVYTTSNLSTGASPYKVAAVVFDGSSLHGQTITNTNNAQVTYDGSSFTKTYSNGTLTITSSGAYFQAQQYRLEYSYGGSSEDIHIANVQVGSGATSISFNNLEGSPIFYSLIFKSNFSTSNGYQRVIWVAEKYDGEGAFGMSMDSAARYSNTQYSTYSSSDTSVTISTSGTNSGGYFHQPGNYQLTYVTQTDDSGGGESGGGDGGNTNDPSVDWTTLDLKKRHLGDLYVDIDTGHTWRYLATDQEDASTYSWVAIPDSDAAAALATAQNAQSLAESKRRIFVSTPTVPYNIGDVWIDTVNGSKVIKYATANRSTGSFVASEWTLAATAVTDIVREYATNQSATTAPTTGWDTSVPTWQDGWYIWERVTTYTNGTSSVGTPVCISGAKGETGEAGNGIASITSYYATTQLQVAPAAADITSTTIPTLSATDKYLWKKEVVTYTDQAVPSTTSITLIAVYGDAGANGNGYVYVVSTHSANLSAWTGSTTELSSITTGTQILFNLRVAPGGSNTTLNLTLANGSTTGAKAVYYSGTTRLGTQYPTNSMIPLVYNGTAWYVASPYTNTQVYDRVQHTASVVLNPPSTGLGIYVGTSSGYKKLEAGTTFDINYAPLYFSVNSTGIELTSAAMYEVFPNVSLTNNKSGIALTQGKMAYIVGTISGNTFTVDTDVFATAPTGVNDKIYIPVGLLSSSNQIYFQSSKELYKFDQYRGFALVQNATVIGTTAQYALSISDSSISRIASINYTYAVTANNEEPADITSVTPPATSVTDQYLWEKTTIVHPDGSTTVVSINKLNEYVTGKTVSSVDCTYLATASDTTPLESAFSSTTIPNLVFPNIHLWEKRVISYAEQIVESDTVIRQIYVDWSETVPNAFIDSYLWSRDKIIYAIGDPAYTVPVCVSNYTRYIMQPDLESVKEYTYTQSVGLIEERDRVMLQNLQSYVAKDTYNQQRQDILNAIEALPDSVTISSMITTQTTSYDERIGALETFKNTYGQRFAFTPNGLIISNAAGSAVQTVLTNSAWQITAGGAVVQQVDATDGAQFSTITIKQIAGGSKGRLVLGNLTIEVQTDGTVIGRKTG